MDILNALSMMYVDGTTNTANAISVMRTDAFNTGNGDRVSRPNVGVVITDGRYRIHPLNNQYYTRCHCVLYAYI